MKKLILGLLLTLTSSMAFADSIQLPFSLPWMNSTTHGSSFNSADHPNGVFVIEAYFLGCPYCNDNATNVDALATKFASEPRVSVLDVGVDRSESQYQQWIERHNPNHPVLNDGSQKLIGQLGTSGFPSTYVVDCKGNVVTSTTGQWGSSEQQQIEDGVRQALGTTCSF